MNSDAERAERKSFEAMKLRLQDAFATPDSDYEQLSADDIRNRVVAVYGKKPGAIA